MLDNSTPKATAVAFLQAIKGKNPADMHAVCHPEATACLIRQGKPIYTNVAQILEWVTRDDGTEQDEVSHDEVEHCDGDLATVWTPYKFYVDGKVCVLRLDLVGLSSCYSYFANINAAPSHRHEQLLSLQKPGQRLVDHCCAGCREVSRRHRADCRLETDEVTSNGLYVAAYQCGQRSLLQCRELTLLYLSMHLTLLASQASQVSGLKVACQPFSVSPERPCNTPRIA